MSKNLTLFIITGAVLGAFAALLVKLGNPGNMGICAACFLRDTTGALGFHNNQALQYVRPEIIGIILGGLLASIVSKDFKGVSGSSPFSRFTLGVFAMIGCLVFLGCPWRAFLRLGGGDMTAIFGVLGLVAGVFIGRTFKKNGYKLNETNSTSATLAALPIILSVLLLIAAVVGLKFGENGAIFKSVKGVAAQHASVLASLILAICVGFFVKKSGFCSVGAISRVFDKKFDMIWGVIAIILAATILNLAFGNYKFGFENQPIAHNNVIWNFLGMTLAGLCFSLSEGCPGKHLALSGGGNLNSVIFIFGMMAGAGISHNFTLASSGAGITNFAPYAVIFGFIVVSYIGFSNIKKSNF
ncbi:YedE family putative selenium transporter [Campylobacter corcagiensis]|uniref:YedE-related selenium metabolism membrane protein n=1 Tax=Campylobacter corcagiensis TaxID=1448857 RepID=A0A7M1LHA5_9BACT|nr:YedE family putative selenium transporter [Campylobacter corcagiensis]QKF64390.1 putative selenium metabolism protein, YedE family [Campylobacter corcagiensis]QOQ87424.1 YedE-related selenium metabolism membrane protein [Campylobacter corcagiensis]